MLNAADCLASTGNNPTGLILVIAVAVIIGVSALWMRHALTRGAALLLIAGLALGALFAGSAGFSGSSAQAAPVASACASPTPSPTEDPSSAAPVITNEVTTYTLDAPFTVTASGTAPIDFYVYTFTYMQFTATGLTFDKSTGVMTPPNETARRTACTGNEFGNTDDGVTFRVYAHNSAGESYKDFTIDDHSWCHSK